MTGPKILITGATGAIGYEMLKQLHDRSQLQNITVLARPSKKNEKLLRPFASTLKVVYGDVTDYRSVEDACREKDMIIHLAALIPPASEHDEAKAKAINIEGTRNVVQAIEEVAPNAHFLFSSSVAIYGDRIGTPPIHVNDEPAYNQHDAYGRQKIAAEQIIRDSKLNWTIFRLSAIMGIGNHKVSALMFDVPLNTPMEIATVSDTARALVHAIDKRDAILHRTFNLSGGEPCRIYYNDFLARAFDAFGLGKPNFHEFAFAKQNFHCAFYQDADELEDILKFRRDTIESYFEQFRKSVPPIQRVATRPFAGIVKFGLQQISGPYKAYRQKDPVKTSYYFGE